MADVIRNFGDLYADLADNTTGDITAEMIRQLMFGAYPLYGALKSDSSFSATTTGDISSLTAIPTDVNNTTIFRTEITTLGGTYAFSELTSSFGLEMTSDYDDILQDGVAFDGSVIAFIWAQVSFTTGSNNNQSLTFSTSSSDAFYPGDLYHVTNGTGTDITTINMFDLRSYTAPLTIYVRNNTSGTNHVTIEDAKVMCIAMPVFDLFTPS